MDRSAGPALRWLRALLLAAVSVAGGAFAHVAADGLLPGWGALAALFLLSAVVAASLLGRPASTARVVSLLMVGQTLIHGTLTAMAGHEGASARDTAAPGLRPGAVDLEDGDHRVGSLHDQLHNDPPVLEHLTVPSPLQHVLADLNGPNALMALAHLVAAAAVGLWLAMGERALWTVLALASHRVERLVHAAIGAYFESLRATSECACAKRPDSVPANTLRADRRPPRLLLLCRALVRRGPPYLRAA